MCITTLAACGGLNPTAFRFVLYWTLLGVDSDEYRGITLSTPYRLLTVRQVVGLGSPLESCGHFTMGLPIRPNDPSGQNQ